MAEFGFLIFYTLISATSLNLIPTAVASRSLPYNLPTTVLHVSDAIQRAQDLFSPHPVTVETAVEQQLQESSISSSSLTLQLLPRASIHGRSAHRDYRSLTLARLERDSARVDSLNLRLDLAVNGMKGSDLKPAEENSYGSEDFDQVPITSGTAQGSGEYFCRIGIGSPAKDVYMVVDTGSDVSWLQCAPCGDCYTQADPIFEPASSSSYAPLPCAADKCRSLDVSECRNGSCLYEVSYGDGSYTVGDFATETLTLGSASVGGVAIGCGHNNEGLFVASAGLLGLGGGALSLPSQLNASSFSYCLVNRDSTSASTLDFDSPFPRGAVTAPLLRSRQLSTFYFVGLAGIYVGDQKVDIPEAAFKMSVAGDAGVIVDSGTAVTRLQTDAYDSVRDAFVKGARHLTSVSGVALFDTCYDLSSMQKVDVPTVSFRFEDGKSRFDLPASNILIPVDDKGTFCFAFAPTSSSLSIIGNVQQQGTRVSIDVAKSVIGFSPASC